MAVKKAGKSALDYDPLSWLKEESDVTDEKPGRAEPVVATDQPTEQQTESQSDENDSSAAPAAAVAEAELTRSDTESGAESPAVDTIDGNAGQQEVVTEPVTHESAEKSEAVTDYIHLDPELTMKNVAEFKQRLDQLMHTDTPIAIDADELRKIDSAGLQLLYSLQKSLSKNGASITIRNSSEVIDAAAAILGMKLEFTVGQRSKAEIEAEQGFGFF